MYRKLSFLGSFLLIVLSAATASATPGSPVRNSSPLQHRVSIAESFIRAQVPSNSLWSFSAVSFHSGERVTIDSMKDNAQVPASLVKLIITASVLEANSREEISLDTEFAVDGDMEAGKIYGNLYMKGYGNALLSEDDIRKVVEKMSFLGIETVSGDIVVDDLYFDISGWKRFGDGPAYAPPGALGLDLHTTSLSSSGHNDIDVTPVVDSLMVIGSSPDGYIHQVDDLIYKVPEGKARGRFALSDPAVYAGLNLKTLLNQKGITVKGEVRRGQVPPGAEVFQRVVSRPLSEIIRHTNAYSLNVFAENLLLLLGAREYGSPGTFEKGVMAVKLFLERLGLPSYGVVILDGSGLSGKNSVTAEFMALFLEKVSWEPWFKTFYESLPMAGLEGTIKDIGYTTEAVRAKTGQTGSVYSLAGYVNGDGNDAFAFSLIVNVDGADLLRSMTGPLIARLAGEDGER